MSVRIYKPARNAMQSGKAKHDNWVLEFVAAAPRTVDPLMGWTSSADTREPGEAHLRHQGRGDRLLRARGPRLPRCCRKPRSRKVIKKSYSDNFKFGRTVNWTH